MGIMSALAANCGTVIHGKFMGCKFSLGSDSKKIIDTALPNQLLFIKLFKEVGRMTIATDVESYKLEEKLSGAILDIVWKDGESSKIDMPLDNSNPNVDPRHLITAVLHSLEAYRQ